MTRLICLAALCTLAACSAISPYSADGGHIQEGCTNGHVSMSVKVIDVNHNPVSGATVTATHRQSKKQQTGTTDSAGVTNALNEDIGAGDVDIIATEGNRTSSVAAVLWTCGVCDCLSDPASLTITIQ
jgi:hypothetical protein